MNAEPSDGLLAVTEKLDRSFFGTDVDVELTTCYEYMGVGRSRGGISRWCIARESMSVPQCSP